MPLDKITETIAHFIGLFEIATETARARDTYHEFRAKLTGEDDQPIFHSSAVTIRAPHDLDDFDPKISYDPQGFDIVHARSASFLTRSALEIGFPVWWHRPSLDLDAAPHHAPALWRMREPQVSIDPPGSVAAVIHQQLRMSDEDHVSYGDHGLAFDPPASGADLDAALDALLGQALDLLPAAPEAFPASPAEMKDLVLSLKADLDAFTPAEAPGAHTTVVKADTLSGIYVNGVLVDAAPDYLDYRPAADGEDEDGHGDGSVALVDLDGTGLPGLDGAGGSSSGSDGVYHPVSGVEITTGGNNLINTVSLASNWLAATVTAVAGDYVELNAIIQANVFGDHDLLTGLLGAAGDAADTVAFNIATFLRVDPQADAAHAAGEAAQPGDFPSFWAVTQVTGDLLICNWIEQLSFMADGDVAILSAMGGFARIGTGENGQFNDVSLSELGQYYDLIVIGGSVFDANIIWQLNVLLDDDLVGAVNGFHSGAGTVDGGGNLLWNEAAITNVGAADRFSQLPQAYRDAIDGLAAAGAAAKAPADLLTSAGFVGLEALRVLYVTGDVINLQFIKQMNVLGDADQVALAMGQAQAQPGAEWTVSTGANTLVNAAAILDVDALGATHVGGGVYSDEILIQAELVSPDALHTGPGGDALVNEAVAFLTDDGVDDAGLHGTDAPLSAPTVNSAQADPMNVLHA